MRLPRRVGPGTPETRKTRSFRGDRPTRGSVESVTKESPGSGVSAFRPREEQVGWGRANVHRDFERYPRASPFSG